MRRMVRLVSLVSLLTVLGLALAGCQDNPGFREIPEALAGEYVGTMSPFLDATRQDTIAIVAAVQAVIRRNGAVVFEVTSVEGAFTATGGIDRENRLFASGILNGDRIDFTGEWFPDFGTAFGTWINRSTAFQGTWQIGRQGVADTDVPGAYTGSVNVSMTTGSLAFTIAADGDITGEATGVLDTAAIDLTGGINFNFQVVMTGTTGAGDPVLFIGTLDPATTSVTNAFIAAGLDGIVIGNWSADK